MPITAPGQRAQQAAGEFKETTAAYRKTGPVEKYKPPPDQLKKLMLNGLSPIAPRIDELTSDGKKVTVQSLRAAEVAAKLQKGEALEASGIAQAQLSVIEAIEVGLEDPNSPYYQADTTLRAQRAAELETLGNELDFYLTGGQREFEDITVNETRRRWRWTGGARIMPGIGRVPGWFSSTLNSGITLPRRETVVIGTRIEQRPRASTSPLTTAEIGASSSQSRVTEAYGNERTRIAKEMFGGRDFASLNGTEKRIVVYSATEKVSRQFRDAEARKIVEEAKAGGPDDLENILETGNPAEKALARKMQKYTENTESLIRRSKELSKIKTMAEFRKFLGVNETTLSDKDMVEAIAQHLGIVDERAIKRLLTHPNDAYRLLIKIDGEIGTILFTGELYSGQLEKFAQDKETPRPEPERKPGETPRELSAKALSELSPQALGIRLLDGNLSVEELKAQGLSEDLAKKIIQDAEKYLTKRGDSYFINEDALGDWNNKDLAVLLREQNFDFTDATKVDDLKKKLAASLKKMRLGGKTDAERQKTADDKIKDVQDLLKIENSTLSEAEQKKALSKWGDKKSLAILALVLGMGFINRMTSIMPPHEARAFESMFA